MCCLFGFYNYSGNAINNMKKLTNSLAEEATARGVDATGIAYNEGGKLIIHKEPKSAFSISFNHSDDVVSVMGHTRHSTQGDKSKNYNNHPFSGSCNNGNFALAHNGVLTNDTELRKTLHLPHTKIKTDSYIAVQLIEKQKTLELNSIKYMAEKVEGSFAFSILDSKNCLWLVRGDSPLALIHFPKYKLYVYASTEEILYKGIVSTNLFSEIKKGDFEEIEICTGDILKISTDGTIKCYKFEYTDYSSFKRCHWWDYDMSDDLYMEDLKSIATYHGYTSEDIDDLISSGLSPDEIEEYLYCME